jgi:hypothetical protein
MSRIEQLTGEQIARIPEFVDRWTKIGLCTDPADRPRAEAAIREMYRQGGLEPPRQIVWCGSPLSQILTRMFVLNPRLKPAMRDNIKASVAIRDTVKDIFRDRIKEDNSALDSIGDSVWDGIKASVAESAGGFAGFLLWDKVRDRVEGSVMHRVGDSVRDSVCRLLYGVRASGVRDSVAESIWDTVRIDAEESVIFGPHEADWLAVNRYFHDVLDLTSQTATLSGLWELAQSAGWALPHENICWVSERHNVLALDDRDRLHSLTGPACAYPDGWEIFAVHGVRVPAYVIEKPHEISVERINAERNAEVRRVMIERYRHGEEVSGAAAFIRDAGAARVDHDERHGTLWHRNVEDDEPLVMVEVINSTREPDGSFKRYWLRVHPELRPLLEDNAFGPAQALTARNAVASTFGLLGEQYAPVIEA